MTQRRFDTAVLFLIFIALVMYATAAESVMTLLLGVVGVVFGRLLGWAVGRRAAIPAPASLLLVIAVCAATVLRAMNGGFNVELFSEFIIMLLAVKMLDRRRARDDAQLITLAVFLAIGAVLTNNSIWVGVMLLGLVPMLAYVVIAHQIIAARERGQSRPETGAERKRDTRRLAWTIALATVVGGTALFIFLPRGVGHRAFGSWGDVGSGSVVGFDDSIELGNAGLLSESPTPVLDVQFLDRTGRSVGERGRVFYLRGAVLNEYNAGAWSAVLNEFSRTDYDPGYSFEAASPVVKFEPRGSIEWDVEQRITLRNAPREASPLFVVLDPLHVAFAQFTSWRFDHQTHTMRRTSPGGKLRYIAWSKDRSLEDLRNPRFAPDRGELSKSAAAFYERAMSGEGNTPEARIRDLTVSILDRAGIDADPAQRPVEADGAAARVLESYLGTSGGFSYSLEPGRPPRGQDPTTWFLFESKAGHCEYFASAMTVMCWSVGIPARVITGYVASEYNELNDHYLVRESNAHAWVEIRVARDTLTRSAGRPAGVWRTFDPTPRADFMSLHQRPDSFFAGLRRAYEAVEFAWVTNVVGFGADSHESIFGEGFSGWLQRLDRHAAERVRIAGSMLYLRAILVGLFAWAVSMALGYVLISTMFRGLRARVLALLARVFRFRRSRRPAPGDPLRVINAHAGHAAAHASLERLLDRAGVSRDPSIPLQERARALEDPDRNVPAPARDTAARVVASIYALVYGQRSPDTDEDDAMRRAARELRTVKPAAR